MTTPLHVNRLGVINPVININCYADTTVRITVRHHMCDLRHQLHQITDNGAPETHPQLIQELGREFPHSIDVAQGSAPNDRYTCAMHAFDLVEDPEYIAITKAAPRDLFASPRFVERLIALGHLAELARPQPDALVVYLDGGAVKHIGRLLSETRVESKWGVGHLYYHGLFEVPSSYGSELRFFEPVDREFVLDRYVEYARENGVRFEDDA